EVVVSIEDDPEPENAKEEDGQILQHSLSRAFWYEFRTATAEEVKATGQFPVVLDENESIDLIVGPTRAMRVWHRTDGDGDPFIDLEGIGCNLRGEMPGMYYFVEEGEGI